MCIVELDEEHVDEAVEEDEFDSDNERVQSRKGEVSSLLYAIDCAFGCCIGS